MGKLGSSGEERGEYWGRTGGGGLEWIVEVIPLWSDLAVMPGA